MQDVPIATALALQLETDVDLGGEIEKGGFFASVNDQPLAIHVPSIFEEFNQAPESRMYERFDTWMIPHRISLMRRSGLAEPTAVGIEVEYLSGSGTCSIISLYPTLQWRKLGSVGVRSTVTGAYSLAPTGELSQGAAPAGEAVRTATVGGLRCSMSAGGEIHLDLSANVATPYIHASGIGSSRCEWRFDRDQEPLYGRDIEAWSVIVVSKYQEEIRLRTRYYFVARTLFVPTRRESEWVEITCKLQKPEALGRPV